MELSPAIGATHTAKEIDRETGRYLSTVFKYYVAYQMYWENRTIRAESLE